MTGYNDFAPNSSKNTTFVVKNITTEPKVVKIFHYPILPGQTRDLLKIPGVGEADIRASLLKGELNTKLVVEDIIVVASDIDLLQFNTNQFHFLSAAGISTGLQVTPAQASGFPSGGGSVGYELFQNISLTGAKNGINRKFFTPSAFIDGAYQGNVFHIEVFHNGRKLINGIDFSVSVTGHVVSGFNTINFISFVPVATSQIYANYYVSTT